MTDWYPLKLEPSFRERVWGRDDVSSMYPSAEIPSFRVGEVWLTADDNRVTNGSRTGRTLGELCVADRLGLVGSASEEFAGGLFPLLVKFLFTSDKLSVQIHPSDEYARKNEKSKGKTEMWHVLAADREARLAIGFSNDSVAGTSADELRASLDNQNIERQLKWFNASAGDSFFIPAGTVHALGAGFTVCEIQQNSDITYRLYDYCRVGTDGKPRALHVEKAISVLDPQTRGGPVNALHAKIQGSEVALIAACPYFISEKWTLSQPAEFSSEGNFEIWTNIEGDGAIEAGGEFVSCRQGEAIVIPADLEGFSLSPRNRCTFLRSYPPKSQEDPLRSWRQLGVSSSDLSRIWFV